MPLFALAAASILGAGLEIFGAMGEASRQRQQAEWSAQQDELNADFADTQAKDALSRGHEQAGEIRQQGRAMAGAQRVGYAASGVDLSGGSPADVLADTAAGAERDAVTTNTNAFREAFGFKFQGDQYRERASMSRRSGKNMADSTITTGGLRAARYFLQAGAGA